MKKILIVIGVGWLGFSLYSTSFTINLDFWAALLPMTYAISLLLLITSR